MTTDNDNDISVNKGSFAKFLIKFSPQEKRFQKYKKLLHTRTTIISRPDY